MKTAMSIFIVGAAFSAAASGLVLAECGDVRLKGPVGDRLDRMVCNHVIATDTDYITEPFLEKAERRGWWQTEFWGKYMHSAMPYLAYTGDSRLKARIEKGLDNILKSQEPSGYIGNYPDELRCNNGWDVWGMKYTMMGLMQYYDGERGTGNGERALAACRRLCDYVISQIGPEGSRGWPLYKTGGWCGLASSSILEPVVWLYNRTKDEKYLAFADYVVKGMTEAEDGPRLLDLALKGISVADRNGYGNKPDKDGRYPGKVNRWKAYEMMSCYQGLLEYSLVRGRKDIFDAAVATCDQIIRDEINIAGGSTASEAWFHGSQKQHLPYFRLQETCVTTTWMRFAEKLLELTGDPKYADELEKTFYNIYLASMNREGSEFSAYIPLNGYRYSGHHHCFMHTNCCNANGPRGFLAFLRALFCAKDDTAVMNFYVSGRQKIKLPKSGRDVVFESYALYPRTGQVRLTNRTVEKGVFTLALRIPAWSANTIVKINDKKVEKPVKPGTYFEIAREWTIGDVVDVTFDMAVKVHVLDHYLAFSRGPIALARDTRFADGPIDEVFRENSVDPRNPPVFTPARSPNDNIWMTFTASLPIGSHHENPEGRTNSTIHFCDYASAGNLWEPGNAFRTWFPVEWQP